MNEVHIDEQGLAGTAAVLGVTSATLSAVGRSWDHQYAPLIFALAPVVAVAGLTFATIAIRRSETRTAIPALIGGTVCGLALIGYVYALLAFVGGGN